MQHSIGLKKENVRDTALRVGGLIADECWAKDLTEDRPLLAEHAEHQGRQKTAVEHRKKYAHTIAARMGYKGKDWDSERRLRAGEWVLLILLEQLRDVFTVMDAPREDGKEGGEDKFVTLTPAADKHVATIVEQIIEKNTTRLPSADAPRPWTQWDQGAYWDKRRSRSLTLVRKRATETEEAVRQAIRSGEIEPTLRALNALQSVPWTINKRILDVLCRCEELDIKVSGVPEAGGLPPEDETPADLTEGERIARKIEQHERHKAGRRLISDRALFVEDLKTAGVLAEYKCFYTPMNLDFRGRVNNIPHFHFQREDRVRALFLFAEDEPLGDKGLYWLKVHTANCGDGCGDGSRISKQPFAERVAWVERHRSRISAVASGPLSDLWWTKADKPFAFLAACFELDAVKKEGTGTGYASRLPVTFDGSCSGLQHLCAMTRSEEGAKVNLTDEPPQDVYQVVADAVKRTLEADLKVEEKRQLAQVCLDYVWAEPARPRKTLKRNVMTYAYSSTNGGMADQIREDTMEPLALRVLRKELDEHPFGPDRGRAASRYLANSTYNAIKQEVKKPAEAMKFLQKIVRTLAREGKHLHWTTPTGFPLVNAYQEKETKRIHLWLYDRGTPVKHQVTLSVGDASDIVVDDAVNAVAPNLVHACDAAHLMLTVNAAVAEGITSIATVHDCFGCLPSRAERFRKIIREQFVRMYEEHDDVLAEVLEQARKDLNEPDTKRMACAPPSRGSLDIKNVLSAEYAFA